MEMGSLTLDQVCYQTSYFKEFKRESLYLRWVNDKIKLFLIDLGQASFGKKKYEDVLSGDKAKELTKIFKDFLQVKMKCKFQNISKLKFKYFDVNNVEILEEQLDNFRDLYVDPDSYEFDEESYELNIDIKFPSFRELFKLICLFNDKIKKEEPIINWICESDSDSDSD